MASLIPDDAKWIEIVSARVNMPLGDGTLYTTALAYCRNTENLEFEVDQKVFDAFYRNFGCHAINTLRVACGLKDQPSLGQRRLSENIEIVDLGEKLNMIRKALCQYLFRFVTTAMKCEQGLDSIIVPSIELSNIMWAAMFYDKQNAIDFLRGVDGKHGLMWISGENLRMLKERVDLSEPLKQLLDNQEKGTLDKNYKILWDHFEKKFGYRIVSSDAFDTELPSSFPFSVSDTLDEINFFVDRHESRKSRT